MSRLYFIPGVPTSTEFKPRTKYEIRAVEWFPIDLLPSSKKEAIPDGLNLTYNSLYMVLPFVRSIRKWVAARRRGGSRRKSTQPSQTLPPNFQQNDRKKETIQHPPFDSLQYMPKSWMNFRVKRKDFFLAIDQGVAS